MHPLLKELERDNDPHDVLEIAPGVVLAARAEPEFATLAPGAVSRAAEPIFQAKPGSAAPAQAPSLDATFRADGADHRRAAGSPIGKWTKAIIGLLFADGQRWCCRRLGPLRRQGQTDDRELDAAIGRDVAAAAGERSAFRATRYICR